MMLFESRLPPLGSNGKKQKSHISLAMILRALATAAIVSAAMVPAFAQGLNAGLTAAEPRIRAEAMATGDTLSMKDLIENWPSDIPDRPVFKAPPLGETGTIQTSRILDAASRFGLEKIDTNDRTRLLVTRPARQIQTSEIEAALKLALERRFGLNMPHSGLVFDGTAPSLNVDAARIEPVLVENLSFDARSRRLSARIRLDNAPDNAALNIGAILVEMVETAILTRSINRGDTIQASDIVMERRARETLPADIARDMVFEGMIARRALSAGSPLRNGDVSKAEAIAKGDIVTIIYQTPGLMLTLRGKAMDAGAKGDVISVQNQQSKKILQATITGPGQVMIPGNQNRLTTAQITNN